nr:hypothetical protein Iba_scaffold8117CG0150 [Ipomoea batatas]
MYETKRSMNGSVDRKRNAIESTFVKVENGERNTRDRQRCKGIVARNLRELEGVRIIWKKENKRQPLDEEAVWMYGRGTLVGGIEEGSAIHHVTNLPPISSADSSHHSSAASYEDLHAQQLEEVLQSTAFNGYEHELRSLFKPRYLNPKRNEE